MEMLQRAIAGAVDPTMFGLTLLPTEKCNFRCTYCYEDFAIGRMKPAVVAGVKALIAHKAPRLRHLDISWFGGEPLLARELVIEVTAHAKAVLAAASPRARMTGSMTTNGFLLGPEIFGRLLAAGVGSYQISLDGDAEAHDRTRVRADGRPSFDAIWANLVAMQANPADFDILLRVHLTAANLHSAERLLDAIEMQFGADRRFRVAMKPIGLYGRPGPDHPEMIRRSEQQAVIARLGKRLRQMRELVVPTAEDARPAEPVPVCYAAKANALVVRADGRLAKCTVALGDDHNMIGRLREDGTLDLQPAALSPWLAPLAGDNRAHLACPLIAVTAAAPQGAAA